MVYASVNTNTELIAQEIGVSIATLFKCYKKELQTGKEKIIAMIGGQVVKRAIEGSSVDAFFYLKTQGRWKENHDVELSGSVNVTASIADMGFTRDEFLDMANKILRPDHDD